jgi:glycosyltransferase involved in cell wall biosynthesis
MMQVSSYSNNIHLWIPDLFNFKGGIQVYSAFLLEALESLYPDVNYDIFLKHDTHSECDLLYKNNTNFHFSGVWPLSLRTSAFAAQIIGRGLWERPNLVITTHLNFAVAAYWLKRVAGIPYWTVAHGVEAWNIQRPALQRALHHADRILAVSNYTRDRLLKEQNLDPSKVSLLPNTFDHTRFKISEKPPHLLERYGLRPDQPIILTVNRLCLSESYKGYDKVLKALPQIRQVIPNVHYIIVGKGDARPHIEQLIRERQLQDCVTLAGFIPDAELCDYYDLCDVFAMPSKLEGFGIVYLEALACGKPTLGGNQDGATDALCQGQLGALVNPDDVGEIAKTIIQIIQGAYPNPILYQPEVLRQKVIDIYGFDQFNHTLSKYLEEFFVSQDSKKSQP